MNARICKKHVLLPVLVLSQTHSLQDFEEQKLSCFLYNFVFMVMCILHKLRLKDQKKLIHFLTHRAPLQEIRKVDVYLIYLWSHRSKCFFIPDAKSANEKENAEDTGLGSERLTLHWQVQHNSACGKKTCVTFTLHSTFHCLPCF